jgi:hypothetical protein
MSYFFKFPFNIILPHIHKYSNCSETSHVHKRGTSFVRCARTHSLIYIFEQHKSEITFSPDIVEMSYVFHYIF